MDKITKNLIFRATSDILPLPDLALNLQIVDTVNNDPQSASYVAEAIVQQLSAKQEIVVLTFELMEMLMKNSKHMHKHFGSKKVMDIILGLALGASDYKVKELAMDFIQFYGNLFQYLPKLHFYPTLVTLKTKKVKLPSLRKDQWKPDGYKEPPKPENLTSLDGPITSANLYYKINQLSSSKTLFDEVVENLTDGEENMILKELYPQCLELHKQFVMFIQESGHKCQDKVLQELLTLNDDFADSLKKYQNFLNHPDLLKQRDKERANSQKGKKIEHPKIEKYPELENPPIKETPMVGDLLIMDPLTIGNLLEFPSGFPNPPLPMPLNQNTMPPPFPIYGNGTQPNLGNPIFGNLPPPQQINPNPMIGNIVEPLVPPPPTLSTPLFTIPQTSTTTPQLDLIFGSTTTPPNTGEEDDPFAALALRPRPTTTSVNH